MSLNSRRVVALLGRRDEPTDAVEEYCRYLGEALRARAGVRMEIERVAWAERGWSTALREVRQQAAEWNGEWVFVQYTALAWSVRGFPFTFLKVMMELRAAGARVAIIFHDVEPYGGKRLVDRMRRALQLHTMRRALHEADLGIFTVALRVVSWLGQPPAKARFIPIGANLLPDSLANEKPESGERTLRVAIFGVTEGETGKKECAQIAAAAEFAAGKAGRFALHVFGRGASESEKELRSRLRGAAIDLQVDGVLPAEQIAKALRKADAMLFVREAISSRRGSAIAGISCGLPVICYGGAQTAEPITDAGVVLVSQDGSEEMGDALARVLSDVVYRATLAERSREAHKRSFSWDEIAKQYLATLDVPR
jgi:glycosyltransferase involved in cell wall biosynthesis